MDDVMHRVVVNERGQFGLLPLTHDIPGGWTDTGWSGTEAQCMSLVDDAAE